MKRLVFWGFGLSGLLAAATSFAGSVTYYVLELRGGSKISSVDSPVRKGRLLLFHRYPDGVFLSLTAAEVDRISALDVAPPPAEKLAPGGTVYVGPALSGPNYEMPPAPAAPSYATYVDSGYSGYGDSFYGGGYFPPPRPLPPPRVPSDIGPNGFPILAPPGSAGAAPPRIGANGYPIISPPPVVPAPRRR
jgi:hypothetical protein